MHLFFRFFYEFIAIFVEGLLTIGNGFVKGIGAIIDYKAYIKVINSYKVNFAGTTWIFVGLAIALLIIVFVLVGLLIFFGIRKIIGARRGKLNQEGLLEEIVDLNEQVAKLMKEKDAIMAMKVSKLGLKPEDEGEVLELDEDAETSDGDIRFPKLAQIDERYKDYKPKNYNNNFTLAELMDNFRCYAASQLRLYYDPEILRPFIAGLACGKLIILQGISGTGKTSLAYAWGKFVNKDSCIASVEPSWRDKTELLGYFNEFTKKFNESDVLAELYEASYTNDVHTIILDEMNIARVEYYFAEMLSILEMPSREEWIVELVTSGWPNDPTKIASGKLKLPHNLWYIGTINNDDSTFMVTDKVYDRAMPIDINTRIDPFKSREQEAMNINASYLENIFLEAETTNPVSATNIEKVKEMDDYVIKHFRIAFGNRIMKQLNTFVPVYVATGGKEVDAIDYFMAKKVLRKFDQLNIALIRDEIDPFVIYLNKQFGNGAMKECIEYLERLKKTV